MTSKAKVHIENVFIDLPTGISRTNPLNAMSLSTETPEVGKFWPEQGGVLAGIMPAEEGRPAYYLIVPTDSAAEAEKLKWGGRGHEHKGLSSRDGKANTEKLEASGQSHPAAEFCANLQLNGFDDYYLPSRREASLMAATLPEVMSKGWHWTSTQYFRQRRLYPGLCRWLPEHLLQEQRVQSACRPQITYPFIHLTIQARAARFSEFFQHGPAPRVTDLQANV